MNNNRWIALASETSGTGNDSVFYEVRENFTSSPRHGTMTIAGQTLTITQDAETQGNCTYFISPTSRTVGSSGGTGSITLTAESRCAWQAVSSAGWITVTSASSGIGEATVNYTIASNPTGNGRRGTITIAGRVFSVKQK